MGDFLPKQLGKLRRSLQTFVDELPERAARLGVPPEDEAKVLAALNAALGAMDAVPARKIDYKAALAARDELLALALGIYRPVVARMKFNENYTEVDGAALAIAPRRRKIDPATLKPDFNIRAELQHIRLRIRLRGASMVGILGRRLGEKKWTEIMQSNCATALVPLPPIPTGQAEVWEFCVFPYLGNTKVGLCSDIKTVVLGVERVAEQKPKQAA